VTVSDKKSKTIAFWTTTALIALTMLSGGVAQLMRTPANVEGMVHLGYPPYLLTILGVWKVLGAIVIVVPGLPRLKEWAYAGIVFDLTGAVASHAASADALWHIVTPGILAGLTLASWALRSPTRILGTIMSANGAAT
jgi:uncharacterized membrane protein YphA (DoxX/SURF4 family)